MEENNMLDKEFKDLILCVKEDILKTRFEVQTNANIELIKLYFRIGKIVYVILSFRFKMLYSSRA